MNLKTITSLSFALLFSGTAIVAVPTKSPAYEYNIQQKDTFGIEVKKQALITMESINETFRDLRSTNKNSAISDAITNVDGLIAQLEKANTTDSVNSSSKSTYERVLKQAKQVKQFLEAAKSESSIRKVKQEIVQAKKNLGKALGNIDKAIGQNR